MRNFLLGALAVVVIGAAAAGAYYMGTRTIKTGALITPSPTVMKEEPTVAAPTATSSPAPTVKAESDNDLIRKALYKKNNWEQGVVTVTVSTNDGTYASGTATAQGGGGYFYAKKVGGEWVIVADGNGIISCASLEKYPDYPNTLISGCYDEATGQTVKR